MYDLLRPILFRLDAERAHDLTMAGLSLASRSPGLLRAMSWLWRRDDPRLKVDAFGLSFSNPLGLAAGMDKDARAVPAWAALGFGSAEVGTVTALPQEGNPRPRLFRVKDDLALINRMGFNNAGARAAADRIRQLGDAADSGSRRPAGLRLGINVGKSRARDLTEAAADYRESLELVWELADYIVLNVSSPNTPGLRQLQERGPLVELLGITAELQTRAPRPVLLKIAPDLTDDALLDICSIADGHGLSGIIATNTTISREGLSADPQEQGGLSGLPLRERSAEVLRVLRSATDLPLVSAGGIWSGSDAVARIRAGASLLQVFTPFVYRGPALLGEMRRALLSEVEREGVASVQDLIGMDA